MRREPELGTVEWELWDALKTLRCARLGAWEISWLCACVFCAGKRMALKEAMDAKAKIIYVKPAARKSRKPKAREKRGVAEQHRVVDQPALDVRRVS